MRAPWAVLLTWPSLRVSSLLGGLLVATYVRAPSQPDRPSSRLGGWALRSRLSGELSCPVPAPGPHPLYGDSARA